MSKLTKRSPEGSRGPVIKTVDRWVARKRDHEEGGHETEWLGWDAWVRTAEPSVKLDR